MNPTVPNQLVAFLKSSPVAVASAELQRMQFRNRNGATASPKAISRRLQELAEDGTIKVEYRGKNAYYSYNPASEPPKREYIQVILPDGTRAVREVVEAPVAPNLPPRSEECVLVGLSSILDPWTGMPTGEQREVWG